MNVLVRLRNARPAVAPATLDRDALFASITAGPTDASSGRSRPRPRPAPRRRTIVVTVATALVALTAGTAFAYTHHLLGWHEETHLVSNPRQWRALYRSATRQLVLPPGASWPYRTLAPNTITSVNEPGGMAVGISQTAWECYWAGAIRRGDVAAQARAHAALADILAHHVLVAPPGSSENVAPPAGTRPPFEIYASDGGIQYVRRMYREAAAGDPRLLNQSCRANGPIR
jgi:hypothetical protein